MKILFIAPRLPFPTDTGGKIRTLNILKQVAKWARVHLVSFSFEPGDQQFSREMEPWLGIKSTLVPQNETSIINKVKAVLFDKSPFSISKYQTQAMQNKLIALHKKETFDVVHIDHVHMAHYRECFNGTPCILDQHNVEYKILERCVPVEKNPIKRFVFNNQAKKMQEFEKSSVALMSRFLTVSEDDRMILEQLIKRKISGHVIPNGVDTEYFKVSSKNRNLKSESQVPSLVFTGSMDWMPNEDAVLYFCKDILPLIWEKNPQVQFTIVGKDPTKTITDLAGRDKRIIVTGRVDDVRPLIEAAQVFVVPIRIGGGTRLKILEAMAMEKAVVSTTIGAEGMTYTAGENILLADTPVQFAQKVLQLFADPSLRGSLEKSGRHLVSSKYDWNFVGQSLKGIYEEVCHAGK